MMAKLLISIREDLALHAALFTASFALGVGLALLALL
jgi:hypothetical protein